MKINQPHHQLPSLKLVALTMSIVVLSAMSACGKKDDGQTAGEKLDAAVASTNNAVAEAKAKVEASMAKGGDALKDATQNAEASGAKTADSMAGKADDVAITASILAEFAKDADLSAFKIDVDTKDGNVTLYGPATTSAAREKATILAKSIKGVISVSNKLIVKSS